LVAGGEDGLFFAVKFVVGGDVADGGVQAHGVVVLDEAGDEAAGLLEVERGAGADAVVFEGFVPAFDLAVGLGTFLHFREIFFIRPLPRLSRVISHSPFRIPPKAGKPSPPSAPPV
jgi:hypothetical protein